MTTPSSTFVAADGDGYERQMGRWSRRLAPLFVDFAGTADAERVLDVGCGTGSLAQELLSRSSAGEVVGVDFSSTYIDYARARIDDRRASFEVGDACALALPDRSFDRVLSLLMLHFVPRADEALAQMRRVAKPGATVAAAVWDNRGGVVSTRMFWDTAAMVMPSAAAPRARQFTRPMTRPGELERAFHAAGFEQVVATVLVTRMAFESFDDYWSPYEGRDGPVAAWVSTLDEVDRTRVRDAVRDAYLDGEPDGPRSYAALAWAVKGVTPA